MKLLIKTSTHALSTSFYNLILLNSNKFLWRVKSSLLIQSPLFPWLEVLTVHTCNKHVELLLADWLVACDSPLVDVVPAWVTVCDNNFFFSLSSAISFNILACSYLNSWIFSHIIWYIPRLVDNDWSTVRY